MNLTKNLLVALRTLPKAYVIDGTMAVEYGPQPGCVFVVNGVKPLPPICYYPKLKKWKRVKMVEKPAIIRPITGVEAIGRRCMILTPTAIHATK